MIKQGYSSNAIKSFKLLDKFDLTKIENYSNPAVIFGMYNNSDFGVLKRLKSDVVIFWAGMDVELITNEKIKYIVSNKKIRNVACMPNVITKLKQKGLHCEQIPLWRNGFKPTPINLGDKIYSYVPSKRREYYGFNTIKKLNLGNKLIIGDLSINGDEWRNGKSMEYYSQCYIGLSLSPFAGGGTSVIELGLCGIKSVNNITDFPNSLRWNSVDDIKSHIENEKNNIGKVNNDLAQQVYEYLDNKLEWLNV